MISEGGIVHDRFVPEVLQRFSRGQKEKNTDICAVETGCREIGEPWKDLENDGRRTICTWDVGILSPREQAEEEKQAGIQGQWQLESQAREYLQ